MKYQRQQALGSIANPREAEARASMTLADTLQQFGDFGMKRYGESRMQSAREAAGETDIQAGEELELLSSQTMYGRQYNQLVKQAYSAATRNDYSKNLNQLSLENPNNVVAFEESANAYMGETLNSAPTEMRNFMRLDMEAMREKYAQGIRARQAEDAIAAGVMEKDSALDGLANDAFDDLRQGRDDTFLMRRQAYVDFVSNSSEYNELQKQKRIQSFDRNADKYYHVGEVERLLNSGNVSAAVKYKNRLAQGAYKTFGDTEADRDAVMADLNTRINGYFQQQRALEAEYEDNMNDRYRDNANKLGADIFAGDANVTDITSALQKGDINLQQAVTLKSLSSTRATTIKTDPAFKYEFALQISDMSDAQARAFIDQGVKSGRLNGGDAATYLEEISSGKYTPLNTDNAKSQLGWLRSALQMDNSLVDMTNASAVLRAEAYDKAKTMILDGEMPRDAVRSAFAWYNDSDADMVNLDIRIGQIKTMQDFSRAATEYNQMKQTLTEPQAQQLMAKLKRIKARLDAGVE